MDILSIQVINCY